MDELYILSHATKISEHTLKMKIQIWASVQNPKLIQNFVRHP